MCRALLVVVTLLACAFDLPAQNSRRKIRRPPSELAAKAGTAVPWRKDVEAALAEARRTGRPVFWYVPSVARSPMDRKPEIDRYMMGGPFSWPSTVELLGEHFVPVKQVAGPDERAQRLGLRRGSFIEPGYVVLDADGAQLLQVDQITTFHPQWFEAPLRRLVQQPIERFPAAAALQQGWADVQRGRFEAALGVSDLPADASLALRAERLWLEGVAWFRRGQRSAAVQRWQRIVDELPAEPLAWKAALEVEGHGPFVRGFEVYCELPAAVLQRDPHDGTRAPVGVWSEERLWQRGVAFLLGAHDDDGVYRDSTYDFGGTDGLPNVHAAVTCLVGEALLAARARCETHQLELPAAQLERLEALLQRLRANATRDDWLALSDRDEILWARAYALRFLEAWRRHRQADREALGPGIRRGVAALVALQPETGAWFHEYGNPFAIATALQALHAARAAGFDVPQDTIDRGLRALASDRTGEGAFTYSHTREGRKPRARVDAAAGRMPLCELGLYLFDQSDQERLIAAVDAGHRYHGLLAEVRKYDDHANRLGYGGFFFWFDMLGRAEAIAAIEQADARKQRAADQRAVILDLPEFDGAFVDSHELGRCYGTAMALLCLDVLDRASR